MLVWVDPEKGATVAEAALDFPRTVSPLVGPLVMAQNRAWLFTAVGENQNSRTICELAAQPP